MKSFTIAICTLTGFGVLGMSMVLNEPTPSPSPQQAIQTFSIQRDEIFKNPTSGKITLTHTPAGGTTMMVFLNGVLLTGGIDYTPAGAVIAFSPTYWQLASMSNPIIQVIYWGIN